MRERDSPVPDRHLHGRSRSQPGAAATPQGLHRRQRYPRRQRLQHRRLFLSLFFLKQNLLQWWSIYLKISLMDAAALRRRRRSCRERADRREGVLAEADALALAVRAHHQRAAVPRGAPHGSRQRRRQRHRRGHALPVWQQAGPSALAGN